MISERWITLICFSRGLKLHKLDKLTRDGSIKGKTWAVFKQFRVKLTIFGWINLRVKNYKRERGGSKFYSIHFTCNCAQQLTLQSNRSVLE